MGNTPNTNINNQYTRLLVFKTFDSIYLSFIHIYYLIIKYTSRYLQNIEKRDCVVFS